MIARRILIALLVLLSNVVDAQQVGGTLRVGVISPGSASESPAVQREPFERGLRELGWKPGSNVMIEYRYAESSEGRLKEVTAELVRLGVDVIVARGPAAIAAARQQTASIPIVMAFSADPVAEGLIRNLARPGGNITGMAGMVWELDGKRLELLKEMLPGLKRVAILTNPGMTPGRHQQNMAGMLANMRALAHLSQLAG